ncbi:hypothetical protein OEG84_05645 [Hoeflea sp. G2-23]|uniref:Transposase n=1 Tax=Hoeflea algicola TaxID=2983763 RepID=A0ABT3Z663_9HYPH|nr:hypothetical protein [Hoeflea algicola]MCY0147209.1 hypothetical protein [Hoeflea algicola]
MTVTEQQIIGTSKEQEAVLPIVEVCRKPRISSTIIYKYKAKHDGVDVSDPKDNVSPRVVFRAITMPTHRFPTLLYISARMALAECAELRLTSLRTTNVPMSSNLHTERIDGCTAAAETATGRS